MATQRKTSGFTRNRALGVLGLAGALSVSAAVMAASLQSAQGWWIALVALVPLLHSIRTLTPARAAVAGGFWGLSFAATAALAGLPTPPATVGAFLLLTLSNAVYAYWGSRITRRVGFSPLMLGLGWVAVELALQPLGMQHGLLAGVHGDGLFVRVVGYAAGYLVAAFLLAYINAMLLDILTDACTSFEGGRAFRRSAVANIFKLPNEFPHISKRFLHPTRPRAPPV